MQTFPNFALSYIPQHNDARMVDVAGVGEGGEIKDRLPSQEWIYVGALNEYM